MEFIVLWVPLFVAHHTGGVARPARLPLVCIKYILISIQTKCLQANITL